jgi:Trypsin-like peptidase domain
MMNYSKASTYNEAPEPGPMREVTIPLLATRNGQELYSSGTAFFIAPWLALTAKHVVEDFLERFDGHADLDTDRNATFNLLSFQVIDEGKSVLPLSVTRIWTNSPSDIAILQVAPSGPFDNDRRWKLPRLRVLPPDVGSRIWGFGYPNATVKMPKDDKNAAWIVNPATTVGEVKAIHFEHRDSVRMPFPSFQVNARFDGGMSGGPVFSDDGCICGVVCSNLPPLESSEEHASYVTTLWPSMGIQIDASWEQRPKGSYYPLWDLVEADFIGVMDQDRVTVRRETNGEVTVSVFDPRGASPDR